jgi:hypothetical protein
MTRPLTALAVLATATLAVSPSAAGIAETIKLTPRNGSGVTGTATIASPGDAAAAAVRVNVRGLQPRALVRIQLNVVDRKNTSASTVLILSARANALGTLLGSGRVRYRGNPVTFATIADGAHAISVVTGGKLVARGIVPGID